MTEGHDDLAEELCLAIKSSAGAWALDNYTYASSVMFYIALIGHLERNPFPDDEVHRKVMAYVERQLDEVSSNLLQSVLDRLGLVIKRVEKMNGK